MLATAAEVINRKAANAASLKRVIFLCVLKLSVLSSCQLPAARVADNWQLATAVPFLRACAGRAAVKGNSKAGVDSRGRPYGGGGFWWSGFRCAAPPAAGVARRVGDRAVGCACQPQAARSRVGRGRTVCRGVGAAARARPACLRRAGQPASTAAI